jgi:hypothetical protein
MREAMGKPHLALDLCGKPDAAVADWLKANAITVLNVAGPRESGAPGAHGKAAAFLRVVIALVCGET